MLPKDGCSSYTSFYTCSSAEIVEATHEEASQIEGLESAIRFRLVKENFSRFFNEHLKEDERLPHQLTRTYFQWAGKPVQLCVR